MWAFTVSVLLYLFAKVKTNHFGREDPVLYYYGIEESERGLPECLPEQACAAHVERAWRAPALVRLCRCTRRLRCDAPAAPRSRLEINNRAYLQFCKPVASWPKCDYNATALTVETNYDRMNPDDLEEMHHKNLQLTPPKILLNCRCPELNYWKNNSTTESDRFQSFKCASLPPCKSGEYCGNVSNDLHAVYQSCLCPKHHICVLDAAHGGVPHREVSELLYRGKGWEAYCQPTSDFTYEDYYE